ncbi:MAG: CYTH domain-containing protein [Actinomycetota bacterium]
MSFEIERRFVVDRDVSALCRAGTRITQGYLWAEGGANLRVRLCDKGGLLTLKGPRDGIVRREVEVAIPAERARLLLDSLDPGQLIHKTRYLVDHAGMEWMVDVFDGDLAGLVIAEVELDHPQQPVALPDWLGREITGEARFGNSSLARLRSAAA